MPDSSKEPANQMPHSAAQTPATEAVARRNTCGRSRDVRNDGESGQALVEFALVLPIIIVILFGIVVFGVALNDWIDETQLASEAARFASVDSEHGSGGLNEAKFLEWVKAQGDNAEVQHAKAELCSESSAVGSYVRVKLTNKYKWFG